MKRGWIAAAAVLLAAASFAAGRRAGGAAAPAHAAGEPKVLHYACPMHPTVKADGPGTAPCCGMALEPVRADGGPAAPAVPGTVRLTAAQRQLQGVRLGKAERAPSRQRLRLFGRVVPDETRIHVVDSAVDGTVREVAHATTGSFVEKGERMGSFFAPDVRAALQGYLTALDTMDRDELARVSAGLVVAKGGSADTSARFAIERLLSLGVSPQQIEEFRRTRLLPVSIDVRAPVAGLVVARDFFPGRRIGPGMECFRIANLDRVWVLADVPEGDAALVRPGAAAKVALPGRPAAFAAVVSRVPHTYDPASQTLKVRLELANPGAALRPEMPVDVELEVERAEAVTVPEDAVVDAGLRKTVFVQADEGVLEPRSVETGWRAGGRVEIRRGLEAGEVVVVSGTFMVDSESQLRAAAAGAPSPKPAPGPATEAAAGPVDPVCAMAVDPEKARAAGRVHQHGATTFYFCSDHCRAAFLAEPGRFAGGGHPPRAAQAL